jgi:hypothetical protein
MQAFGQRAQFNIATAPKKKCGVERRIGVAEGAVREHAIGFAGNLVQLHRKHS